VQPPLLNPAIERLRRPKLSDQVAERIEAMIVDGSFPPGSLLPPERELMQLFGVGRPSIREALFALNRMGLVAINSGERARVTAPTPDRLITELSGAVRHFLTQPGAPGHFQEARALFEIGVARIAAVRRTEDELARLEAALRLNEAARGDAIRFGLTDVGFHYVLAAITGNPIFTAVHDALAEWLTTQRTIALRTAGIEAAALAAHKRIFDAVHRGDPDAAGAAMAQHLEEIGRIVGQHIEQRQAGNAARRKRGGKGG
jgi:DNA-binding FadR family transcriptional regulator